MRKSVNASDQQQQLQDNLILDKLEVGFNKGLSKLLTFFNNDND
jgi:hypothetical protein